MPLDTLVEKKDEKKERTLPIHRCELNDSFTIPKEDYVFYVYEISDFLTKTCEEMVSLILVDRVTADKLWRVNSRLCTVEWEENEELKRLWKLKAQEYLKKRNPVKTKKLEDLYKRCSQKDCQRPDKIYDISSCCIFDDENMHGDESRASVNILEFPGSTEEPEILFLYQNEMNEIEDSLNSEPSLKRIDKKKSLLYSRIGKLLTTGPTFKVYTEPGTFVRCGIYDPLDLLRVSNVLSNGNTPLIEIRNIIYRNGAVNTTYLYCSNDNGNGRLMFCSRLTLPDYLL